MEFEDESSTNFMPENLLKILSTLENDATHHRWKLIRNKGTFTLVVTFPAKKKPMPSEKLASGSSSSQHTDKNRQDSSDVRLVEQQKRKKKKTPAQVERDRARRKAYWKRIKVARQLRAHNLALHRSLQESRTVASSDVTLGSQSENSDCLERSSTDSETNSHLIVQREPVFV